MKGVFFDMDGTLYDVRQYFIHALRDVANHIASNYGLDQNDVYDKLITLWEEKTSIYPYLFSDLLGFFDINDGELGTVIDVFNNHVPELEPYIGVLPTLQELKKRGCKLGIITDGTPARQDKKIKALGIEHIFDVVVFTKGIGHPKPSPIPYRIAMNGLNTEAAISFYIGDNPLVDFKGAKEVGMKTIRLKKGEFKHRPSDEYVDHEIDEIEDLLRVIKP